MPFRWTINPYRGCSHACVYLLRPPDPHVSRLQRRARTSSARSSSRSTCRSWCARELARPSWKGEHVALGTNTDPYQWVEGRYRLMRGIWEAMRDFAQPVLGADQVAAAASRHRADEGDLRARPSSRRTSRSPRSTRRRGATTEPHTPHPRKRIEAVAELNARRDPDRRPDRAADPRRQRRARARSSRCSSCATRRAPDSIGGIALHLRGEVRTSGSTGSASAARSAAAVRGAVRARRLHAEGRGEPALGDGPSPRPHRSRDVASSGRPKARRATSGPASPPGQSSLF